MSDGARCFYRAPVANLPLAVLVRISNGERLELHADATAGRVEGCEVPLNEGGTSRTHARLTFTDGTLWVEDLGSANGTFINTGRIAARVRLKTGDRLSFGVEAFEVALAPTRVATPAVGTAPLPAAVAPVPVVAAPAPVEPAPAPAISPKDVEVTSPGVPKRPGSWAQGLTGEMVQAPGKSTKYLAPAEIKQMMANVEVAKAPAPDMDVPYLQILSGKRSSVNVPLRPGAARLTEWSIGSDPQRELVLPDDGVSAFHARIMNEGKRWKVIDQMSANGTFVNGKRSSVSYVSGGDRLHFGPVECMFQTRVAPSGSRPAEEVETGYKKAAATPAGSPMRIVAIIGAVLAILALAYWKLR